MDHDRRPRPGAAVSKSDYDHHHCGQHNDDHYVADDDRFVDDNVIFHHDRASQHHHVFHHDRADVNHFEYDQYHHAVYDHEYNGCGGELLDPERYFARVVRGARIRPRHALGHFGPRCTMTCGAPLSHCRRVPRQGLVVTSKACRSGCLSVMNISRTKWLVGLLAKRDRRGSLSRQPVAPRGPTGKHQPTG